MRIYVENIEIPKNCDECILHHECEMSLRLSKRPFDCPFRQDWIETEIPTVIPENYTERIK